jgi:hypothetical protein
MHACMYNAGTKACTHTHTRTHARARVRAHTHMRARAARARTNTMRACVGVRARAWVVWVGGWVGVFTYVCNLYIYMYM